MAKSNKQLNFIAQHIIEIFESRLDPAYCAGKRKDFEGQTKYQTLCFAHAGLDDGNKSLLAERLGISFQELSITCRVVLQNT